MLMNQHFPVKNVAFAVSQPVLIESLQKKSKQTSKQTKQWQRAGNELCISNQLCLMEHHYWGPCGSIQSSSFCNFFLGEDIFGLAEPFGKKGASSFLHLFCFVLLFVFFKCVEHRFALQSWSPLPILDVSQIISSL